MRKERARDSPEICRFSAREGPSDLKSCRKRFTVSRHRPPVAMASQDTSLAELHPLITGQHHCACQKNLRLQRGQHSSLQLDLPLTPEELCGFKSQMSATVAKYHSFETEAYKQLMKSKNTATVTIVVVVWCLPNDVNQLGGRQLLELPDPQRPQRSRSRISLEHIGAEHICALGASCFNVVYRKATGTASWPDASERSCRKRT